jgi:hypothetical protein
MCGPGDSSATGAVFPVNSGFQLAERRKLLHEEPELLQHERVAGFAAHDPARRPVPALTGNQISKLRRRNTLLRKGTGHGGTHRGSSCLLLLCSAFRTWQTGAVCAIALLSITFIERVIRRHGLQLRPNVAASPRDPGKPDKPQRARVRPDRSHPKEAQPRALWRGGPRGGPKHYLPRQLTH